MKTTFWIWCTSILLLLTGPAAHATDVDGPNDCQRSTMDRGDAPEGFFAYPGVIGHFPTCLAPTLPGTQEAFCPPISTVPGPTGYVVHLNGAPTIGYWLGCGPTTVPPLGIDSEPDGKTSPGAPISACADIAVDCVEATPVGNFGQDECFGDSDAGLLERPSLSTCSNASFRFETNNCGPTRTVRLNVLIDMNGDGDWNDNFDCTGGSCANEWAVKNVALVIPGGACSVLSTPNFLVGPRPGFGWMRISISDNAAPDDFPWNGSVSTPNSSMVCGETEDYVVEIVTHGACPTIYRDFGDAPEGLAAYPSGILGHFPTCKNPTPPGTQDLNAACPPPISTVPGLTGWVEHVKVATDSAGFWFGCNDPDTGPFVDSENDGKVNLTPPAGTPSFCDDTVLTDCVAGGIPGMAFGQDECYADGVDAGLLTQPVIGQCDTKPLRFRVFNCADVPVTVFINLLVDWNGDGDWNDVVRCERLARCVDEWAVVNLPVTLPPGCSIWTSPPIQAGPRLGFGWMRATMTRNAVATDFPWNGSGSEPNGVFRGGETEDYPVVIEPSTVDAGMGEAGAKAWFARIVPNPSRIGNGTTVHFGLQQRSDVKLTAYDVRGRLVRTIVDGELEEGLHSTVWEFKDQEGKDVVPGVYFLRLEAGGRTITTRVTRLR